MKLKLRIIPLVLLLAYIFSLMCGVFATPERKWTQQQIKAHEIAELARSMGLPEDDPIIERARELWHADEGREDDIRILATVIYNEAGNGCAEEHMLLVGRVVMNRVNDERFPNTVYDVVVAPYQYLPAYAEENSRYKVPASRLAEFEDLARRVLDGEPYDCPANVLYQDNNRHGTGVYKTFNAFGSSTYFCYG